MLHRLLQIAVTMLLALAGALSAEALSLPLPWMMGSMVVTAAVSLSGVQLFGQSPGLPKRVRWIFIPVIGISIAAGITPDFLERASGWVPSLLGLAVFMAALQTANFAVFRRLGRYDRATAWFAASPGGAVESMLLGENAGGQASLIVLQHSLRVILAILVIPPSLLAVTTSPLAAPDATAIAGAASQHPLTISNLLLIGLTATVGGVLGVKLRLPAGIMLGPLVCGGFLYGTGQIDAQLPLWLIHVAQLVIGALLGTKFTAQDRPLLLGGLRLGLVAIAVSVSLAGFAALGLFALDVAPFDALFLGYAPGGLAEMSLVALSLGADPVFVAAHHLMRIFLAVALSPSLFKLAASRWRT